MKPNRTHKPEGQRNKLLAKVHILIKDLGMDDETYRAMLENSFGVNSAGKLNMVVLRQLVMSLGRSANQQKRRKSYPGRPHNVETTERGPQLAKIEALLTEAGREWAYADTLAQRICKVEMVAWVETGELYKIISALVKDAQRNGRRVK